MSRRKMPRSVAYKLHLRLVLGLTHRAYHLLSCMQMKARLNLEWTEDEKAKLREASNQVDRAETLVREIFAARIGQQAVKEAVCGDDV